MESGSDLLSRAVSSQVPSALKGLTSVFGMGTGGTPSSSPPEMVNIFCGLRPCWPLSAIRLLNSRPFLPPFSSCLRPASLPLRLSPLRFLFRMRPKVIRASAHRTLTTAQRFDLIQLLTWSVVASLALRFRSALHFSNQSLSRA